MTGRNLTVALMATAVVCATALPIAILWWYPVAFFLAWDLIHARSTMALLLLSLMTLVVGSIWIGLTSWLLRGILGLLKWSDAVHPRVTAGGAVLGVSAVLMQAVINIFWAGNGNTPFAGLWLAPLAGIAGSVTLRVLASTRQGRANV